MLPVKKWEPDSLKSGETPEEYASRRTEEWLAGLRKDLLKGEGSFAIDLTGPEIGAWEIGALDAPRFHAIYKCLKEGVSPHGVARIFDVNEKAVEQILATHRGLQTEIEEYQLGKLKASAVAICDRVAESVHLFDVDKLPGAMRAIFDQIAMLEGKPTSRTEKTVRVIDTNDLLKGLASADVEVEG